MKLIMTITIEGLMRVGDYEISITPCSLQEKGSRAKDAMCFTVREFDFGDDLSGGSMMIACAVAQTLDEVLGFVEKQMDEKGLIPLPDYTTHPQERVRPQS